MKKTLKTRIEEKSHIERAHRRELENKARDAADALFTEEQVSEWLEDRRSRWTQLELNLEDNDE